MSYICEFCGLRPENCACSVDLSEPRLETELAVADNIMAVENPIIQRQYGLLNAPSASAFFSLLMEMESESKYDTPPSTPSRTTNLLPIPKLERQTNRPPELYLSEEDIDDIAVDLFPSNDFSHIEIKYCEKCRDFVCDCERTQLCYTSNCKNMVEHGMCYDCIMAERRLYPDGIAMDIDIRDSF